MIPSWLWLVAGAVLLRRLDAYLPSYRVRRLLQRWVVPPVELLAAASVAGWIVARLMDGRTPWAGLAWVGLFLAAAWTMRSAIEDFVAGALLRMEGGVEYGHRLGAAGISGRVTTLGYRSVQIETDDGSTVRLPWRAVARDAIRVGEGGTTLRAHTFTVVVPPTQPLERILREIPSAALVSPWSSTTQLPEVRLQEDTEQGYMLQVSVHALDARFAPRIEASVREWLAEGAEDDATPT